MRLFLLALVTTLIVPLVAYAQALRPATISSAEITEVSASGGGCSSHNNGVRVLLTPTNPTATVSINCDARGTYVDVTFELSEGSILVDVELAFTIRFVANTTVDVPQAGVVLPIVVRSDSGSLLYPNRSEGIIGGIYPVPSPRFLTSAATFFVLPGDRVTFFDGAYYFNSPHGSVSFSTLPERAPEVSRDDFDGLSGDIDSLSIEVESLGSEVDEVSTRLNAIEELPGIGQKLEP